MHTLTAETMLDYDGTIAVCPLCQGKRVILTEQLVKPHTFPDGTFTLAHAAGRNVETTFLHAPTCEARIKSFR